VARGFRRLKFPRATPGGGTERLLSPGIQNLAMEGFSTSLGYSEESF